MSSPWSEIRDHPYKKWFEFGWESPEILWKRLGWKPIFRTRMMWQRARKGYSVEDCWSLDQHLARVIVGGVQHLKKFKHGYPSELHSREQWDVILGVIEDGFQAWIDEDGWFTGNSEAEEKFRDGMALLAYWFGALWD